jgi:hypothetical protein
VEYLTTVRCPVCGEIFDEITHPRPEISAFGVAMLSGTERSRHLDASPKCYEDDRWIQGWTLETKPKEDD